MDTFIPYFIKVNISIAVVSLLYKYVFKKDTFFKASRWYFLGSLLFSFIYPLFSIDGLSSILDFLKKPMIVDSMVSIEELSGVAVMDEAVATPLIDGMLILKVSIVVITLLFSLRLLWQSFVIMKMKNDSEQHVIHGITYQRMSEKSTPFSFFKWIFVYPEAHSDEKLKQILIHEQVHVKQWHSIDVTLMEVLTILFWYNPFFWILKKEMAINLEYIADSGVLKTGINRRDYQYHLLHLTYPRGNIQLVNNFNVSQLKQRIMMMNSKKTPMKKLLKYVLVLPVAILLVAANSVYAQQNEPKELKGKIIGVSATSESGIISLRGINEGDKPLIVIDGKKMDKDFDLNQFEPNEIESISVLKDKSSTDQYGEDGRNGVIIVSTKKAGVTPEKETEITETSLVIRGVSNGASNSDLLIVIDGEVKGKGKSILENIKPEDIKSMTVIKDESAKTIYGEQGKDGVIEINTKDEPQTPQKKETTKSKSDDGEPYLVVDENPEFPGGTSAMMKFLSENIKYPKDAQDKNIKGRVIISFVVKKDGTIVSPTVVRGVDPLLDKEAERVVMMMPEWKPGKLKGEVVDVKFTLPIVFRLPEKEATADKKTL